MTAKRIIFGALALIIMGVIFFMSAQNGEKSSALSGGAADKLLEHSDEYIAIDDDSEKAEYHETVGQFLRKSAHVLEYAALTATLCLFMFTFEGSRAGLAGFASLVAVIYACADELHQTHVPDRNGTIADVLIDIIGISAAAIIFGAVAEIAENVKIRREKQQAEEQAWLNA